MKIIFFMEAYYLGGMDTFVINLINNWPQETDELILICNRRHCGLEKLKRTLSNSCRINAHNMTVFTGFFELTQDDGFFKKALNIVLKLSSPIVRYLFLIYNVLYLRHILLPLNANYLMIINGAYPGSDSCRAAAICWGLFSKKSLSIHNFHGVVLKPGLHILVQERLVDSMVSRFTKAFVTVSGAAAKTLASRKDIYKKNQLFYIYNGITLPNGSRPGTTTTIKQELGIPSSSKLCLMLGAYHQHKNFDKGHHFLLCAFKKVVEQIPQAHLLICGFGYEKDIARVRTIASNLKIDNNVHCFGYRKDVSYLFKDVELLLVSSQVFESFCFAIVEALAHAVPVVATDVGAISEIVKNGEGGFCVRKDDSDSYVKNIVMLLGDEDLRRTQGQKGYQRYQELFTASRMAKEYRRVIING